MMLNGNVSHVPSRPGKGEQVADRPDEGLDRFIVKRRCPSPSQAVDLVGFHNPTRQ